MWVITKDLINARCGDRLDLRTSRDWDEGKAGTTYPFQLRDDDDEPYFEGVSTDCDSETAFEPLDCVGTEYGCTTIWYKDASGGWELL